jgi:fumarate reductase flavoprotein subunit
MTALPRLDTDILILGSGGAGLFAALHAKKAAPELDVTIAVKGLLGKCGCTRMVQGGYNVALADGDSVERHFMDTVEGGKWLNDQDLAWLLVTGAQVRIRELENELGCFFDRNPDGTVHQKAFAGQTFDRTRATSPASRSSTAWPSRSGAATCAGSRTTAPSR